MSKNAESKSTSGVIKFHKEVDVDHDKLFPNTVEGYFHRSSGTVWNKSVNIVADTETLIVNLFKFKRTIRLLDQWAMITNIVSLADCTNVYGTIYDGTTSIDLVADGIDLSGASVGTFFTKDKIATETFSLSEASQCRLNETETTKRIGRPFTITAKYGVDNVIRLHLTTSTAIEFTLYIYFEYELLDGASLISLV